MVSLLSKTSSLGWEPVRSFQVLTKERMASDCSDLRRELSAKTKTRASASRTRKESTPFWRRLRLET